MSNELTSALESLFVVALVAALAPLVVGLIPRQRVPQVVVLIVGGVIIGPQLLNLAQPENIVLLSHVGLGFLFLLAGYELDLALFRQRADKLAVMPVGLRCDRRWSRWAACCDGFGTRVRRGSTRADHDSAGHTAPDPAR
jgi:hypothetical protein